MKTAAKILLTLLASLAFIGLFGETTTDGPFDQFLWTISCIGVLFLSYLGLKKLGAVEEDEPEEPTTERNK